MQRSTRADDTTQKSSQYSNRSLCYQFKIELHTCLDMHRLYLYAKLSFNGDNIEKIIVFKVSYATYHSDSMLAL